MYLPNVFIAELGYGRRTVTRRTHAFLAYNPRVVQAAEIVGYHTHPTERGDVEHIQKMQRLKVQREKEKEKEKEKGQHEEKKGDVKEADVISDEDIVLAVDMKDFSRNENREMLIYLNYTTTSPPLKETAQPFTNPLASLVIK
jgi:NACalpha-BTF3-like transcription factor